MQTSSEAALRRQIAELQAQRNASEPGSADERAYDSEIERLQVAAYRLDYEVIPAKIKAINEAAAQINSLPANSRERIAAVRNRNRLIDDHNALIRRRSAPSARTTTRARQTRSREHRPASTRRTSSSSRTSSTDPGRSSDPDQAPSPPALPFRIAGPAGDTRGVEAAFLQILTRRQPNTRWEMRA